MPQAGLFSGPAWVPVIDDGSSHAFLRKNALGGSQYFSKLESLPWVQELSSGSSKLTRYTCWLVSSGCECNYKYGNHVHAKAQMPDWLAELTNKVAEKVGVDNMFLNSVCGNKYAVSQHDLTWHSDNEPPFRASEFCRDTFIVSLSFGASRLFEFRKKQSNDTTPVCLDDWNILVMLGRIQDKYYHRLCNGGVSLGQGSSSSSSSGTEVRFNLTWRFLQMHEKSCPWAS